MKVNRVKTAPAEKGSRPAAAKSFAPRTSSSHSRGERGTSKSKTSRSRDDEAGSEHQTTGSKESLFSSASACMLGSGGQGNSSADNSNEKLLPKIENGVSTRVADATLSSTLSSLFSDSDSERVVGDQNATEENKKNKRVRRRGSTTTTMPADSIAAMAANDEAGVEEGGGRGSGDQATEVEKRRRRVISVNRSKKKSSGSDAQTNKMTKDDHDVDRGSCTEEADVDRTEDAKDSRRNHRPTITAGHIAGVFPREDSMGEGKRVANIGGRKNQAIMLSTTRPSAAFNRAVPFEDRSIRAERLTSVDHDIFRVYSPQKLAYDRHNGGALVHKGSLFKGKKTTSNATSTNGLLPSSSTATTTTAKAAAIKREHLALMQDNALTVGKDPPMLGGGTSALRLLTQELHLEPTRNANNRKGNREPSPIELSRSKFDKLRSRLGPITNLDLAKLPWFSSAE
ncbi:unnamed protein product [Amoebophrya sp. A25]|nr:unnamed protein product [Amoebophrya sp. A25]|eukprot:GSA25T00006417001.1